MQVDPKKIAIYLTNRCNLHCKHCFIEGNPANNEFLSWDQIETGLKYFIKKGYTNVEFTGGEPCLSPLLLPALKLAKKLHYSVGINTNGTNPQLFHLITPKLVDKITFSLDGATAKTHDRLRGRGVYRQCLSSIKKGLSLGYRVEVICTVHKYNYREIPQLIHLLDQIGVHRLSFNFISNMGNANFHQQYLLPPEAWTDIKNTIDQHSHTQTLGLRYSPLFVTPTEYEDIVHHANLRCLLSQPVKIELYPDGYFYGCCFTTKSKDLALGHITDHKVVTNSSAIKQFTTKYSHLSCPALQANQLYPSNQQLIPICLYCKIITR